MKMFVKATKFPYGYLLVDLKQFTADDQRLKCVIAGYFKCEQTTNNVADQDTIKENRGCPNLHSSVGVQAVHGEEENIESDELMPENMADKGHACDDCGLLFDTVHDVQRHKVSQE